MRFNLVLFLFMLWMLSQLVIPIKFLPFSLASKIESLKMLIPAVGIIFCTVVYLDKIKFQSRMVPFYLFASFVVMKGYLLYLIFEFNLEYLFTPFMYALWVLVMFVIAPSIFDSLSKVRSLLRCIIVTFSFVFIICFLFVAYFGIDGDLLYRQERLTFVYGNPLYLGAIAYAIICCSLMLRELSKSSLERKLLFVLSLVCFWIILESYSRSFMVGVFTVFVFRKRFTWGLVVTTMACFILTASLFAIFQNETLKTVDLNKVSSGRIGNWSSSFQDSIDGMRVVWGGDGLANYDASFNLDDDGAVDVTFQRYAIDNSYFEIFSNTGVIGLSLFMWGLIKILQTVSETKRKCLANESDLKGILDLSYAIMVSILVASLFYGFYPSLGNAINVAVLPAVMSVIFLARTHVNRGNR